MKQMIDSQLYSRKRIDDSLVIKYLSSMASTLIHFQIISDKDIDDLRMMLLKGQANEKNTLLMNIAQHQESILDLFLLRYGVNTFYHNLCKHTLRPLHVDFQNIIIEFGSQLIEVAQLFFNRTFYLHAQQTFEKQVLFSSFVVDSAEMLHEVKEMIDKNIREQMVMLPHDFASQDDMSESVDQMLATELGFSNISEHELSNEREKIQITRVTFAINVFSNIILEFVHQLEKQNTDEKINFQLNNLLNHIEQLKLEAIRLEQLPFPKINSLLHWENRRFMHFLSLSNIIDYVSCIEKQMISLIKVIGMQKHNYAVIPENIKREINFDLVSKGIKSKQASEASNDLMRYLEFHKISAKNLILPEIYKINSCLTENSIDILKKYESKSMSISNNEKVKRAVFEKMKHLKKSFFVQSLKIVPFFIIGTCYFLTNSCGIKKDPMSEVVEYERSIPFKNISTKNNQEKKHAKEEKK